MKNIASNKLPMWFFLLALLTIAAGYVYRETDLARHLERLRASSLARALPTPRLKSSSLTKEGEAQISAKVEKASSLDPLKRVEAILASKDIEGRKRLIEEVLRDWCKSDPEAATRWAAENGDLRIDHFERLTLICEGLTAWAAKDPRQAADYSAAIPVNDPHESTLNSPIAAWSKKDFAAAKAYVDQMTNRDLQVIASRCLIETLAKTNPLAGASLLLNYGTAEDQAGSNGLLATVWAAHDFDAAWKWITSQSPEHGSIAAVGLAATFAVRDPQAASDWALGLPTSPARNVAVTWVAFGLTDQDPTAAATWINALPDDSAKTEAATTFISSMLNRSPSQAAEVAVAMTNPAAQEEQLGLVFETWEKIGPKEANKWLAAHPNVQIKR